MGYMALKIDLEKGYDKIEWSFIKEMMVRVNLPTSLIDIIMSCVSTVSTSILINGETTDPIFPSRGLRQGDPLSPYLFILCIDYLSQPIEEKCEANHWHPVKTSQNGPTFSHLLFADDLLFFAKADIQNSLAIREVLDDFFSISGQSIGEAKSRVYFSPNVSRELREELGDIIEFASIPTLGKYLGFPLKQVGTSSHDYNFILDRVKQKLTSWKENVLSMAGRSVLIQASLTAIPAHVMQCSYLPGKILEGIDRVNRNFLWGSLESVRKIHWVGWKKVVKSKEEGGLGLHSARNRNIALLSKLNWCFHTEEEVLWARVLKEKYCSARKVRATNPKKLSCSSIWVAMKKGRDVFLKGSKWVVGRDSGLSLWYSNWLEKGPLRSLVQGPLS